MAALGYCLPIKKLHGYLAAGTLRFAFTHCPGTLKRGPIIASREERSVSICERFRSLFFRSHSGSSGDCRACAPTEEIRTITDHDLPVEFRAKEMYGATNFGAKVKAFKRWCARNKVYYYARPREAFNPWEAEELAREAGCTRLILEDLS